MSPNPWEGDKRLPRGLRAALSALHLGSPTREPLRALGERDWDQALALCDRQQITLVVADACRGGMPESVERRLRGNLAENTERLERVKRDLFEICETLRAAGVEHAVLKGVTQWPRYTSDLRRRLQFDIDLFCPEEPALVARQVLEGAGFASLQGLERFPSDHLPPLARPTEWRWRGNVFDARMPVAVELHFRFWDEKTERFLAPGTEEFWQRRTGQVIDGVTLSALHPADALAYNALHLLRHLLRGSVRLSHVYELAWFLERHSRDETFWGEWRAWHAPGLRRLEAMAFRLAESWFGCGLPGTAEEEVQALPADVRLWFERYARSPVYGMLQPNKDELWLHFCLLETAADKRSVLRRRLLPAIMPDSGNPDDATGVPRTQKQVLISRLQYASRVVSRLAHHARALVPTLWRGARWWAETRGPGSEFLRFLLTASVYHLGLFIFFLLYNLYLLDLGYREDSLGLFASAMTAGSIAAVLPSGWIVHRLGIRRSMALCFAGMGAACALRSVVTGAAPLAATAFLGGVFTSLWFVLAAPAVSSLTTEKNRPLGFSLFFSAGIGMGILGGLAGGQLPALVRRLAATTTGAAGAKQGALLAGCFLMALAAWPASRLRVPAAPPREARIYPWSPFLGRFLGVMALWSFAVGIFNPFFTAYFARQLRGSDAQIGIVFSASQLAQVAAVLMSPVVLRRFGLVGGVASMQVAAALTLASLSGGPPMLAAGALYAAYMSFQSMCEPGTYSLLMGRVREHERSGASALNFLVVFVAQAVAAWAAGTAVTRWGYSAVLLAAAGVAGAAGLLFRALLHTEGEVLAEQEIG